MDMCRIGLRLRSTRWREWLKLILCLVDGPAAAVLATQVHDLRLGVQREGQVPGREPPGDKYVQIVLICHP